MERFGLLVVYLRKCCVLADVMEKKLVYLAQRCCRETNVAIGMEFGGIAGTKVSYVAQKVKEPLSWDGQFRELYERAEKKSIF